MTVDSVYSLDAFVGVIYLRVQFEFTRDPEGAAEARF